MGPAVSDSERPASARTRWLVLGTTAIVVAIIIAASLASSRRLDPKRLEEGSVRELPPPKGNAAPVSTDEPEQPPSIQEAAVPDRFPFSGMKEPRGAAVDGKGRVWVADFGNSRLRLFDSDGGYLGGWGGRGNGEHGFRELCGVAVEGDILLVADTWNGRVQSYDLAGQWKATASQFYGPRGVAVAPNGAVWVCDTGNNRLMLYEAQLKNGRPIGAKGEGPGEFAAPIGVAVGPTGLVYVADTGNNRVQVLEASGRFVRSLPVTGWSGGSEPYVEVDQDGTVYVSIPSADAVQVYDPAGTPGERLTADPAGQKFARPTGLAIDRKNRRLYVVNSANNTVSKLTLPEKKKR